MAAEKTKLVKRVGKSTSTTDSEKTAKSRRVKKVSPSTADVQEKDALMLWTPDVAAPARMAISEVSFSDAMRITPLLRQVSKQAQFTWRDHLASQGCDVLAGALAGASILFQRGTLVVGFSEKGTKLMRAQQLTLMKGGLPTLVDSSGRFVENARRLGPLATSTRIAANLWMAAVTVAHVISGADIAKKINKLDAKVDFLVAAHRIDQLARIEGVYQQAKEILHLEQNENTRWELHRLGRELFEVRSAWRREIAYHVGSLQRTEESDNRLVGFFQGMTRKGKDRKVASKVSESDAEIQLISGSIAIHLALSQAAGTLETFLQVSLPDEIAEIERIRTLIHERRDFIHKKHPELRDSVTDVCAKLEHVTKIYRPMILPRTETNHLL